jgi:ribose transport system ATP-binding protein
MTQSPDSAASAGAAVPAPAAAPTPQAALSLTNVVKQYPGVRALDGVDLSVAAGEVHAVLGENGAGKSTLVGVAAGSVAPDGGEIALLGQQYAALTPALARQHGLALVYQVPSLAGSLTVSESMLLLVPERDRPSAADARRWTERLLQGLGLDIDARLLVSELTLREAHLVEIAGALASKPRVLVLDEPTEALGPDETQWLFGQIRALTAQQVAVVYITHRVPEVRAIAGQLTVMRDGRVVGRGAVPDFTDEQIVELIVGRALDTTFPDKAGESTGPPVLAFAGLTGPGFTAVSGRVQAGEILGLAGVEGNGQRQLLRALAGLEKRAGQVTVHGAALAGGSPARAARRGVVFLSGDRLQEAMFGQLSVRENVAALQLPDIAGARAFPVRGRERALVAQSVAALQVKTATLETPVDTLSGGNQQKALLARSALGNPTVLLVEDPTQGVDAGARLEIYRVLRQLAGAGTAIIVLSTDAVELEGLCDRVLVMSRGRVAAELTAGTLSERDITGAAVLASEAAGEKQAAAVPARRGRRRLGGEGQAAAMLLLTIVLAAITSGHDSSFLAAINIGQLLLAASTLMFVSLAQLVVVVSGGIDLSVGSVVAVSVVTVSFFAGGSPALFIVGIVVALAAGAAAGLVNGVLVTRVGMLPVVATLVTSIGALGIAQLLRPLPGGQAGNGILSALGTSAGPVPVIFIVAVMLGAAVNLVLRRGALGRALRATGADTVKAQRMGVRTQATRLTAYAAGGTGAALAGLALFAQTGVGDASVGQDLTLTSVTAVVLGGASIFGGTGSGLATIVTALFLETITSALNFLSISLAWEYWIQGVLVIVAAAVPLIRRRRASRAAPVPT